MFISGYIFAVYYTIEQLWKVSQKLGFKLNIEFEEETEDFTGEYLQNNNNEVDVKITDIYATALDYNPHFSKG
ncbi:MAG: hypothetical protein Q7J85_13910 [Bacillota bacterium]|nr:hypothetical protein [Bacillota bacterium]